MPEKKLEDIASNPNVHADRMSNQHVTIGDVTFVLRPLTMRMVYYAQAAENPMIRGAEQVRLAIQDVQGMEADYETIELMLGKQLRVVKMDWFIDLAPSVIRDLRQVVDRISHLSGGERNKLDFS